MTDPNTDRGFAEAVATQAGKSLDEPDASTEKTIETREHPETDSQLTVHSDVLRQDDGFSLRDGLEIDGTEPARKEVWNVHDASDPSQVERTFDREEDAAAFVDAENRAANAEIANRNAQSALLRSQVERLVEDGYEPTDPPLVEAVKDWAKVDPTGVGAALSEAAEAERYALSNDLDNYDLDDEELAAELARIESEPTWADQLRSLVSSHIQHEELSDLSAQAAKLRAHIAAKENEARGTAISEQLAHLNDAQAEKVATWIGSANAVLAGLNEAEIVRQLGGDPENPDDLAFASDLRRPLAQIPAEEFPAALARLKAVAEAADKDKRTRGFHAELLNTPDGTISSGLEDSNTRLARLMEFDLAADAPRGLGITIGELRKIKPRHAKTVGEFRHEIASSFSLNDGLTDGKGRPTTADDAIAISEGFKSAKHKHEEEQRRAAHEAASLWGR